MQKRIIVRGNISFCNRNGRCKFWLWLLMVIVLPLVVLVAVVGCLCGYCGLWGVDFETTVRPLQKAHSITKVAFSALLAALSPTCYHQTAITRRPKTTMAFNFGGSSTPAPAPAPATSGGFSFGGASKAPAPGE